MTLVTVSTYHYSLEDVIALWGSRVTAGTRETQPRYDEFLAEKTGTLSDFFAFLGDVPPAQVTAGMVGEYITFLQGEGLAEGTIYKLICRISSFYQWAMKERKSGIEDNPVTPLVRPNAPNPYQSESTKALTDQQLVMLINHVGERRALESHYNARLIAYRDYAILFFFVFTGKRLSEIINLNWGDLTFEGDIFYLFARHKGGVYASTEVREISVQENLQDYLVQTGRKDKMKADSPIWLRHDRGAMGQGIGRGGWHKRMKGYCWDAGLGDIHTHNLRDTFARIVSEEEGDMGRVQLALGHSNPQTTKWYVNRVAVRRDISSQHVGNRVFGNREK